MTTKPVFLAPQIETPCLTKTPSAAHTRKSNARFALMVGVAFAVTLPVLGVLDPKVLWALGVGDVSKASAAISSADNFLSRMAVLDWFVAGGATVAAVAAVGVLGALRKLSVSELSSEQAGI